MNKLNSGQWRSILYKFTSDEDFRPCLQKPFIQGKYICATDGHIILRVDRNIIPQSNEDYTPKGHVPDVSKVIPAPDPTFTITLKEIINCLVASGLDYNHLTTNCDECDGTGDVRWEYRDRDCKYHTRIDKCPCCNGLGEIPNGYDRFCTIGEKATLAYHIILTHYIMNNLCVDDLSCTLGKGTLLLNIADGVDIVFAIVPIPESKETYPIKIKKL